MAAAKADTIARNRKHERANAGSLSRVIQADRSFLCRFQFVILLLLLHFVVRVGLPLQRAFN